MHEYYPQQDACSNEHSLSNASLRRRPIIS